jgi:queuine/archaeosine tRNA-ribosyltransferase
LTYHNIRHQMRLCKEMHEAILEKRFGAFVREYVRGQFPEAKAIPGWVREAMAMAEIPLE